VYADASVSIQPLPSIRRDPESQYLTAKNLHLRTLMKAREDPSHPLALDATPALQEEDFPTKRFPRAPMGPPQVYLTRPSKKEKFEDVIVPLEDSEPRFIPQPEQDPVRFNYKLLALEKMKVLILANPVLKKISRSVRPELPWARAVQVINVVMSFAKGNLSEAEAIQRVLRIYLKTDDEPEEFAGREISLSQAIDYGARLDREKMAKIEMNIRNRKSRQYRLALDPVLQIPTFELLTHLARNDWTPPGVVSAEAGSKSTDCNQALAKQ